MLKVKYNWLKANTNICMQDMGTKDNWDGIIRHDKWEKEILSGTEFMEEWK